MSRRRAVGLTVAVALLLGAGCADDDATEAQDDHVTIAFLRAVAGVASTEPAFLTALRSDAIRVEVADDSTAPPVLREATPREPGGRGLALVEALSTSWGFDIHDDGKVVWFEVPRLDADDPRAG